MAVSTLTSTPALTTRRFDPLRRQAARARPVTVRRSCVTAARIHDSDTRDAPQNRASPAAAVLLAALVAASPLVSPPDADAARSSGRVGGSSFRSSGGGGRSYSAPRASAPRASANVYVAPPLGGYGYGGYGYAGGMAMAPSVFIGPSFGFGFGTLFSGLFQLTIVAIVLNTLLSFASNISKGAGRGEDDEDTL